MSQATVAEAASGASVGAAAHTDARTHADPCLAVGPTSSVVASAAQRLPRRRGRIFWFYLG